MSKAYKIQFTDSSKTPITIQPGSFNYDTSLELFGKDTLDWGTAFNTNLVKILENFSNEFPPGYDGSVLEGQTWYDTNTKQLKICTNSNPLNWSILNNGDSVELTDVATYTDLSTAVKNYIPLAGNDYPMTGSLLVKLPVDTLDVANKKYVESTVCACAGNTSIASSKYVTLDGGIISTDITLYNNFSSDSYAASKGYIDSRKKIQVNRLNNVGVGVGAIKNEVFLSNVLSISDDLVYIHGYVTMPKLSLTTTITLPFDLKLDYEVMITGSDLNNLDVPGGTTMGNQSDAYCTNKTTTSFDIKRSIADFDCNVYFTVYGVKSTFVDPTQG